MPPRFQRRPNEDGRFSARFISEKELNSYYEEWQDKFYWHLTQGLDQYNGHGKLPSITHKDRYRMVFNLAYSIHYINPEPADIDPRESENWVLTYDERAQWLIAIPEEICPPGIEPIEQVQHRLENAKHRMRKKAANHYTDLGKFDVRVRAGGLYLRHAGEPPSVMPAQWMVDKEVGKS